jgi:hypothetical protein
MAALGDMYAVASLGTYPTPTPTDAQRAIFAVSYGLLDTAPAAVEEDDHPKGEFSFGFGLVLD